MSFLVPKPVGPQIRTKTPKNCDQNEKISSIFHKIRDLCRVPNPTIESLDERLFVSSVFDNIRDLCRRPQLLTTIEEQWSEELKTIEGEVEPKVWQKKKIQNYSDPKDSNPLDMLSKSKLFTTLVSGRHKSSDNSANLKQSSRHKSSDNSANLKQSSTLVTNEKMCKKGTTRKKTVKSCTKNEVKTRKPLKSLLSIDCIDISSKMSEYSKQYSNKMEENPKKRRNRRNTSKDNSQESVDSGLSVSYESIASPVSSSAMYSMPATPISSTDSQFSRSSVTSCDTTSSSVLSQIRKTLNPKFETYGQYIQKCVRKDFHQLKTRRGRKGSKVELNFKEKVLEWSNKICAGNATPIHNIEYLATPPRSPLTCVEPNICPNDDLNAMIESLENCIYSENNDNFNEEFYCLLSDLYSDIPMDIDI